MWLSCLTASLAYVPKMPGALHRVILGAAFCPRQGGLGGAGRITQPVRTTLLAGVDIHVCFPEGNILMSHNWSRLPFVWREGLC